MNTSHAQTQPATKPAHTPTPWAFRKNGTRLIIDGPNSRMVAETLEYVPSEGEAKANAALIVRACNAWNDVEALKARIAELEGTSHA